MANVFKVIVISLIYTVIGSIAVEFCSMTESDLKWRRDPSNCAIAYFCLLGRPVTYACPEGHVIGANKRFCVPVGSELDDCTGLRLRKIDIEYQMDSYCKPGDVSPDERSCAKYFRCEEDPTGNLTMKGIECDYPELFNSKIGKCESFKEVECLPGQTIPKSPCDYDANQCTKAHCIPCNILYPSCAGLPDGMNSWTGKEWSPYYVMCEEERVTYQGECKSEKDTQIFHPVKRTCMLYDDEKIIG